MRAWWKSLPYGAQVLLVVAIICAMAYVSRPVISRRVVTKSGLAPVSAPHSTKVANDTATVTTEPSNVAGIPLGGGTSEDSSSSSTVTAIPPNEISGDASRARPMKAALIGSVPLCPACRGGVALGATRCPSCGQELVRVTRRCQTCKGTGLTACSKCFGNGRHDDICPNCEGSRRVSYLAGRLLRSGAMPGYRSYPAAEVRHGRLIRKEPHWGKNGEELAVYACPVCKASQYGPHAQFMRTVKCGVCQGTGKVSCPDCGGDGIEGN